jgi:hypothetical protein
MSKLGLTPIPSRSFSRCLKTLSVSFGLGYLITSKIFCQNSLAATFFILFSIVSQIALLLEA